MRAIAKRKTHGLAVLVLVAAAMHSAEGFAVRVSPNAEECFVVDTQKGDKVHGSYMVVGGGHLDINLDISGPSGLRVYNEEKTSQGSFTFIASPETFKCEDAHANCGTWASHGECEANPEFMNKECKASCKLCDSGMYSVCFSNKMSTVTSKSVSFRLYVGEEAEFHSDKLKESHFTPLQSSINSLARHIRDVQDSMTYARVRERVCRDTNESTNRRVLWWSLVEFFAIFSCSAAQIWLITRFVEKKRRF